jgi:thiol:disulfide interchange protein DsbC
MKTALAFLFAIPLLYAAQSLAAAETVDAAVEQKIRSSLQGLQPALRADSVRATANGKLYKITFRDRVFYVTGDGRFLLQGKVIDLRNRSEITDIEGKAVDATLAQEIRKSLEVRMPGLIPDSVHTTPMDNLYEIASNDRVFYVTEDGRFLIRGKLVDLETGEDVTNQRITELRLSALEELSDEQALIYRPEKTRHTVTVFTDTECAFCRRMHSEIDQYLEQGIAFRYLFFVPEGVGSDTYNKAVSVWCAQDRHVAMDKAKAGDNLPSKTCDNPIEAHSLLGKRISVQGTPTLVLADGMILPGYTPPEKLRGILDERFP